MPAQWLTRTKYPPYLKPVLGCLRRNRRRVFGAAVTRYLKSVYAAVVPDIGDFPRRQVNQGSPTESDEGSGSRAAGSGAISARYLACNQRTPGHRWQADPARRAACGPSTGSGAAAAPFQHVGTGYGKQQTVRDRGRSARRACPCASCELARDAAAATCLRRRNTRLPGIICRRLQITACAVLLLCLIFDCDAQDRDF